MKRAFDLLLVLLTLPLWGPLLLAIGLVVWICLGLPVLFRQERAGLNGKPFTIFKFRTMKDLRDDNGRLLPDADRLVPCGRWLRSLSLDELPGLFNVIRGEMSLVGPRPLPVIYVPRYSPEQALRLACTPGITGWAQVNGRNLLDWDSRFQHDIWYVRHRSFWLDLRILWMTLATVVRREGISGPDVATMTEFMGSDPAPDRLPDNGKAQPDCLDPFHRNE